MIRRHGTRRVIFYVLDLRLGVWLMSPKQEVEALCSKPQGTNAKLQTTQVKPLTNQKSEQFNIMKKPIKKKSIIATTRTIDTTRSTTNIDDARCLSWEGRPQTTTRVHEIFIRNPWLGSWSIQSCLVWMLWPESIPNRFAETLSLGAMAMSFFVSFQTNFLLSEVVTMHGCRLLQEPFWQSLRGQEDPQTLHLGSP